MPAGDQLMTVESLQTRIRGIIQRFPSVATFDVGQWLSPHMPYWVSQVVFALVCTLATLVLRVVTDFWLPGAGPFTMTLPMALVATLFGGFACGLLCLALSSLHAWYYVLPMIGSFALEDPTDGPRVLVNVASGVFVITLAKIFRAAMRKALADRDLLLREIEHRVKNNFASVAAMLRLQLRQHQSGSTTQQALQAALGRVESFALVNGFLYRGATYTGTVDMRQYLQDLCRNLETSFDEASRVELTCFSEPVAVERDRAILIGLLVNEVVTNSLKHAFVGRGRGRIDVHFAPHEGKLRLQVRDDGIGMSETRRDGSLGLTLIKTLTAQAKGEVEVGSEADGTCVTFEFER